jgi:radical SAM superfamily enzyme YgiQ (UPF0313 family)
MKIILLRPNTSEGYNKEISHLRACEPPLWLMHMANYYKSDTLIDADANNYTREETVAQVVAQKPDKVIILASGAHPSANIQQKEISGDLEKLFKEIGIEVECYSNLPIDPCKYGPPRWNLVDISKYKAHNWHSWSNNNIREPYGTIFTSISCPYKCEFCQVKDFYGETYVQRPLDNIAKDFDTLAQLNISNIKMMDELFVFNPKRLELICDDIIGRGYHFNIWAYARIDIMTDKMLRKMKQAGINWLAYGIETGSERIRKNVLKGNFDNNRVKEVIKMTKDNGINAFGNYMFGFWEDDLSTMQETLDLAKELNCEFANFYCVVAYPGSKLYDEMKEKGIELPTNYLGYAQMSKEFKPLPTKYLKAEDVLRFRDNAFSEYFKNLPYLSLMKEKFGKDVVKEIQEMTKIQLIRNA